MSENIKLIRTQDGMDHKIDYDALANKPTSGAKYEVFQLNTTAEPNVEYELDLSDYLPKDDYNYIVSARLLGDQQSLPSGKAYTLYLNSDLLPLSEDEQHKYAYCAFRIRNSTSSTAYAYAGNSIDIMVGPQRKIYYRNTGSYSFNMQIYVAHYFRV